MHMPPSRLLVLAWRDPWHPEAGGSERYLHEILTRLAMAGWNVTYVTSRPPGQEPFSRQDGMVFRRHGNRVTVYFWGLIGLVRFGRRADVVMDVVNGVPFLTPLVRRRGVVALVHHVHREQWQMLYPDWRGRLGWLVESRVMPRLYRHIPFITVSSATRADLEGLGIEAAHISIVRNGVNVSTSPSSEDDSLAPRLVSLARLVPHKQTEHALEVLARLSPEFPNLRLDIIGDGAWRPSLESHAAALGIREMVTFHGRVTDLERDALLHRAWVQIFPSVKEGWGLAITEAGAAGVPSIAYRTAGGVGESIEHGVSGVLVDDLAELVLATRGLLTDPARRRRLGDGARAKALSRSWDSAASEMAKVLAQRSP